MICKKNNKIIEIKIYELIFKNFQVKFSIIIKLV